MNLGLKESFGNLLGSMLILVFALFPASGKLVPNVLKGAVTKLVELMAEGFVAMIIGTLAEALMNKDYDAMLGLTTGFIDQLLVSVAAYLLAVIASAITNWMTVT